MKIFKNPVSLNIFSLSIGQGISLIVNFFAITLFARYIGVEDFGKFNFTLAIVVIISKLVDFGIVPTIFREISKDTKELKLLVSTFYFRLFSIVAVVILFNITANLLSVSSIQIILFNVLFLNVILSSKFLNIRELLDLPFKANLKMPLPMLVNIMDNIILLVGVLFLLYFRGTLTHFVLLYVVSNIPGFILIFFLVKKNYKINFKFTFYKINWLLKKSYPIYIFILADILFQQLEIIFLKSNQTDYEVGIYSAALRLVMPLLIFPTAIIQTLFPTISKNTAVSYKKFLIQFTIKILYIFAFIIAITFTFKGSFIVQVVFGREYLDSFIPTVILLWSQVFAYIIFFIVNILVALDKQKWLLFYSILILTVNSILNFFLVPYYSFTGASLGKAITLFLVFVFLLKVLINLGYKVKFIEPRTFLGSVIVAILFYFISDLNSYLFFPLALITSFIVFKLLKVFNKDELEILRKAFPVKGLI